MPRSRSGPMPNICSTFHWILSIKNNPDIPKATTETTKQKPNKNQRNFQNEKKPGQGQGQGQGKG